MPFKTLLKQRASMLFTGIVGVCLPLIIVSEALAVRTVRFRNVNFTTRTFLANRNTGTIRGFLEGTVVPGTGSVAVETDNPLMYFNRFQIPDPTDPDSLCAIGIPDDRAGITGSFRFNFGNQAQV